MKNGVGTSIRAAIILLFVVVIFYGVSTSVSAQDQENCMLCHQYPMLGVVDDNGTFRSFYVSPEHYSESVHAEILCSECHKDVTRIPHEEAKEIDCTAACHIIEPTTGRPFSHQTVDVILQRSVHGASYPFARTEVESDIPTCRTCHSNEKMSLRLDRSGQEGVTALAAKGRCEECHQNRDEYVDRKLMHVMRRTDSNKNQMDTMNICAECHNDADFNKRHQLVNAVYTYRENYHGKIMVLGEPDAPSCIDCHVRLGAATHDIRSVKDKTSATYTGLRGEMCSRVDCHPDADSGLGKQYIHADTGDSERFPIQFWVMFFFTLLTIVSFVGLMVIMIMELIRMMFPNFTFGRRKK